MNIEDLVRQRVELMRATQPRLYANGQALFTIYVDFEDDGIGPRPFTWDDGFYVGVRGHKRNYILTTFDCLCNLCEDETLA